MHQILSGDCRILMAEMEENSVDAIITDPPYGLSQDPDIAEVLGHWLRGEFYSHGSKGFMGRGWDSFVPGPDYWRAAFLVLKPGGYLLAFCSTRTWDLLSIAIRFAGFENRDTIRFDGPPGLGWTYGQGFPKGIDISKAMDKSAGVEPQVVGVDPARYARLKNQIGTTVDMPGGWQSRGRSVDITVPGSDEGKEWEGWNTTLKPAWEVILVFRKPLDGSVVANVKCWGVGGVNVGAARVGSGGDKSSVETNSSVGRWPANWILSHLPGCEKRGVRRVKNSSGSIAPGTERENAVLGDLGDSPGWVAHGDADGMETVEDWNCVEGCPVRLLGDQSGVSRSAPQRFQVAGRSGGIMGLEGGARDYVGGHDDAGTAARFFHCLPPEASPFSYHPKASTRERNEGAEELLWARDRSRPSGHRRVSLAEWKSLPEKARARGNIHPTVKPLALARLLAKLYCKKGGRVLDMFAGSGALALGAKLEGMAAVAMEMDPDYLLILKARLGGGDKMLGMEQISLPVSPSPVLDHAALAARMAVCTKCPARCGGLVPGFLPDVSSPLVVIGPGPGYRERLLGRPFVGGAGEVLWAALQVAGYSKAEVALLNAAACAGEAPSSVELLNCYEFLAPQVRALAPRAILALGGDVLRLLGGGGSWHGIPVVAAPLPRRAGDAEELARAARAARRVTHG